MEYILHFIFIKSNINVFLKQTIMNIGVFLMKQGSVFENNIYIYMYMVLW